MGRLTKDTQTSDIDHPADRITIMTQISGSAAAVTSRVTLLGAVFRRQP